MSSTALLATALSVFPLLIPAALSSLSSSLTAMPPSIPPFDQPLSLSLTPVLVLAAGPSPYGTVECATSSASTAFSLRFISYGNYTALPSQGDDAAVPRLESVSFAVSNAANEIDTLCAFALPLSGGSEGSAKRGTGDGGNDGDGDEAAGAGTWQPCADRKDTDGTHRFTIATGAAFEVEGGRIAVNQTWFCHDEDGRLVAYTGVARGILDMTCTKGEISGYHVQNCTAPDTQLPVTLL
ncbi:hypothetical protein F4775DRAFT_598171 [Biscogniauxia sp. FL1348]|nr:hypothetical protein F4775DRAFT_598171 [Biscogniauxia sp. FL1348]